MAEAVQEWIRAVGTKTAYIERGSALHKMNLLRNDSDIIHFDLLKPPHHGSNNNVEEDFFRRITADTYVVSVIA